ncbi:MAG: hypothetical protein ACE5JA_08270, partial [bacterium]
MAAGANAEVAEFVTRRILQQGITVVSRLFSLMKISQIYDTSNRTYVNHIGAMLHAINQIVQTDGSASLGILSEALFMNGTRLKPDFSSWSSFRFVMDALESKGIGKLTFESGVSAAELAHFFTALREVDSSDRDPFGTLQSLMGKSGISHVNIERTLRRQLDEDDKDEDKSFAQRARKSFYHSISYLKTIALQLSTGRAVNAKKSKRLVQSFVDGIIEDESYMLGLTTIKNYDE